jgi:16S rRNA (guanine527-N7)-methyltransferase
MIDVITKYFPDLSEIQKEKFIALKDLYEDWNNKINVISRKDMDNFYLHHVVHSMAIARIISFAPGSSVLDAGTGGGFPGIPLAILFPRSEFVLMDSILKKIRVVTAVAEAIGAVNVKPVVARVEEHNSKYDFIVSRAVTSFPEFVRLTSGRIKTEGINNLKNGIIYLKGGDLNEELSPFKGKVKVHNISNFFDESFFETKRIVYLPL